MKFGYRNILSVVILFGILLLGCKEEAPKRAQVVSKLKSSAQLATVEYVVTKVISAEKKHLIGRNSYFFAESEAYIKAGIDLDKLQEEDIKIEGKKISLTLPAIEIITFNYPADAFKVVESYTYGRPLMWWKKFDLEERDKLYRQGEEDIRNNIEEIGVEKTAKKNTILLLTPILEASGFEEIYISFKEKKSKKKEEDKNTEE